MRTANNGFVSKLQEERKSIVMSLIKETPGLSMWRAAHILANTRNFPPTLYGTHNYLRQYFRELFKKPSGRHEFSDKNDNTASVASANPLLPSASIDPLWETCEFLLTSSLGSANQKLCAALLPLLQILKDYYGMMPVRSCKAVSENDFARAKTAGKAEERADVIQMWQEVASALKRHNVHNLQGDYLHYINTMLARYEKGEEAEKVGDHLNSIISQQFQKNSVSP